MEDKLAILGRAYALLAPTLDERNKRLFMGAFAEALGHGGIVAVAERVGVDRQTVANGRKEILVQDLPVKSEQEKLHLPPKNRIRRPGAGRKPITETDDKVTDAILSLVEPYARGDPESPLRWTSKSCRHIAAELSAQGHKISHVTVALLLDKLGFSLQANTKTLEGASQHPDRNAQFEFINDKAQLFNTYNQPVISVDAKKKELIGNYKNNGREISPEGAPEKVNVHDFADKELGRVNPYGVYEVYGNKGWVNIGTDNDTAEFAVESIRRWWFKMGAVNCPEARNLFITADGGGSNGHKVRLWKKCIQDLANEAKLAIHISHFPPGTSKWNKIEHCLFSHISMNWRAKPLISHEVIINLISNTTTASCLTVKCDLDTNEYLKGIKISDEELEKILINRAGFHGEWNYCILPQSI
jgi:hypothetical protein